MSNHTNSEERKQREYLFVLNSVEGIGPVKIKNLLKHFGTLEQIFEAEIYEIAQLPRFNPILATRILTARKQLDQYQQKIDELTDRGIDILFKEDNGYPILLRSLPEAPILLCKIGKLAEVTDKCVAIVGNSNPTPEAIDLTLNLSIQLVNAGFKIVSGLANGIDANTHYGTLSVGGITIGVIATDLSYIYPPQNKELAKQICETGCIFSEHPYPTKPTPAYLVMRNRIITGISMATIVVETTIDGGAMHTARYAERQDRPVFACQWNSQNKHSAGTRQLIAKGAIPFQPDQTNTVLDLLSHPEQLKSHIIGTSTEQFQLF